MKNIKEIISGIILIGLSYGSTYLFDMVKGTNGGREMIIVLLGIILFLSGCMVVLYGFTKDHIK